MEPYGSTDQVLFLEDKWFMWRESISLVLDGIEATLPSGHSFVFVGNEELNIEAVGDRRALYFLERDGQYFGATEDDSSAVSALDRLRQSGASFIVFAWWSFWWFRCYPELSRYLATSFPNFVHETLGMADFVVFDLRPSQPVPSGVLSQWNTASRIVLRHRLAPERASAYRKAILPLMARERGQGVGDYLEFGVNGGRSLACMFRVLSEVKGDHVRLFGFDSFTESPAVSEALDGAQTRGPLRADFETTRDFLSGRGIDWHRVHLVQGSFEQTLNHALIERYQMQKASVIMIDGSVHASTLLALRFCRPLIRDEAVLFFDDWHAPNLGLDAPKRAFYEFLSEDDALEVAECDSYAGNAAAFHLKRKPGM